MTEIYRFRSIDDLFEEHQELEKQSIYFASPEELNDPMEGFRDIFWHGDRIIWTNLFRNYLYCLHIAYVHTRVFGDSFRLEPKDIPVRGHLDCPLAPRGVSLFDDICKRVFEKARLHEFSSRIASTNRKARRDEVLCYLLPIHPIALSEIRNVFNQHGLTPEGEQISENPLSFSNTLVETNYFELMQEIEDERFLDVFFPTTNRWMADRNLVHKYNLRSEGDSIFEDNRELLLFDFPDVYLKQLEQLLYPKWYAACFMRDYGNSSVWGHYGDNHKGVCLVFEAEATTQGHSLTLNQITIRESNHEHWGPSPMTFHDINYEDRAGEIDFFRSMGHLPFGALIDQWFKGDDGDYSECGSYFGPNNDEEAWRENYWDNFYRDITIKTKDWEYEQESRLILSGGMDGLDEETKRTLTYDFNSLKGIIFGINTSNNDKRRILETIHRKCREHNGVSVEISQAYYCHYENRIRKSP